MIRNVTLEDASAICDIYNYYVQNTIITFEIKPVTSSEMAGRIRETTGKYEWIVWQNENGAVLGYAYFNSFRPRAAYSNSVESTVYVKASETGKRIGNALYGELMKRFHRSIYHVIIAGIALPNEPSIRLQEKYGFTKIAHFKEVGFKFGKWIDVGYWELVKNVDI